MNEKQIEQPITTRIGLSELNEQLANPANITRAAYEDGMVLSAFIETLCPSERGDPYTFETLLTENGITTVEDPSYGIYPTKVGDILTGTKTQRVLLGEYAAIQFRKVANGVGKRAINLLTDGVPGSWQRPYWDDPLVQHTPPIAPPISLSELIAVTVPIDRRDYRAFYIDTDPAKLRLSRVAEGAEIPNVNLTDQEHTTTLHKYAVVVETTNEQLRTSRLNEFTKYLELMAIQRVTDQVSAALDVLVNGDGNVGTAPTVHNLTTLDPAAVAGTLTLKGWLAFKLKFQPFFQITTALMQEGLAVDTSLLSSGNANIPQFQTNAPLVGSLQMINKFGDGVRYGLESTSPPLKIVGFDSRFALRNIVQIGMDVQETVNFATRQSQGLILSYVNAFNIFATGSAIILDVNA